MAGGGRKSGYSRLEVRLAAAARLREGLSPFACPSGSGVSGRPACLVPLEPPSASLTADSLDRQIH